MLCLLWTLGKMLRNTLHWNLSDEYTLYRLILKIKIFFIFWSRNLLFKKEENWVTESEHFIINNLQESNHRALISTTYTVKKQSNFKILDVPSKEFLTHGGLVLPQYKNVVSDLVTSFLSIHFIGKELMGKFSILIGCQRTVFRLPRRPSLFVTEVLWHPIRSCKPSSG